MRKLIRNILEFFGCRHAWVIKPNRRRYSKVNAFMQCAKCGKTRGCLPEEHRFDGVPKGDER